MCAWAAQPRFLKGSRVAVAGLILLARGASWRLRGTYPPNSSSELSVTSLLWRLRRTSLLRDLCRDFLSLHGHSGASAAQACDRHGGLSS